MSETLEQARVYMNTKQEKNFWESINKNGPIQPHMEDECWEWTGALNDKAKKPPRKYGRVSITDDAGDKKVWRVPKLAYLHFVGPVPPGMLVCHHCDNPLCAKPSHLYLDTHAGNMAARNRRGRQARGETSGMSKLNNTQVSHIYTSKRKTGDIARQYGITLENVRAIRKGQTWTHITKNLSLASTDD